MKKQLIVFFLLLSFSSVAQDGFQFGINISPAWKVNAQRNRITGIRANQSGYGFAVGIPVKYWMNDYSSFNTGLDYEFAAFDAFQNGQLVSSFRFNSLHIPLMFNINASGNWYGMIGSGLVYNMSVKDLNIAGGSNLGDQANPIQPYFGFGVNTFSERGIGFLELGILARYQLLDLWTDEYEPKELFSSHLVSLDLLARFYF